MKLIAYLRVSTVGQAREGLGLPTQERMVRSWCQDHGHRLFGIVSENGKSGTLDETERPGLLEVLTAVRDGGAEGIVVTSLDRLARSLTVQEAILGRVWGLGGSVFTVDQGEVLRDDPDDPMRTALRQIQGVIAELDRRLIVKRLRNGRATKKANGGYAGGGQRYGLRAEGGALVEDDHEQPIVELVLQLRQEGASYREVCAALEERGYHPRRASRWQPEVVRQIVLRGG
jgi:DNA invertase Pin-like site-specific DNA recombinase